MSGVSACLLEVEGALGRTLNKDEKKALSASIEGVIRRKAEALGGGEDVSTAIKKTLDSLKENASIEAFQKQRQALLNRVGVERGVQDLIANWSDTPGEGLKALLGNTNVNRPGARAGLANEISAMKNAAVHRLSAEMENSGNMKVATSGQLNKEIFAAAYALDGDAASLKGLPKEAIETATILKRGLDTARANFIDAGGSMGKIKGYIGAQTHDPSLLRRAAGKDVPAIERQKHMDSWVNEIHEMIDWNTTMTDLPIEGRVGVLKDMWNKITEGYFLSYSDREAGSFGIKNINSKYAKERVINFKTPELAAAYFDKYSGNPNIVEQVSNQIAKITRDTAIMRRLGPTAEANISEIVDQVSKKLKADGKETLIAPLQKEHESIMRKLWPNITGLTDVPVNFDLAKLDNGLKGIQSLRDLGSSSLNFVTDIPVMASALKYFNGGSALSEMTKVVRSIFDKNVYYSGTPEDKRIFASALGILQESTTMHPDQLDFSGPGLLSRANKLMYTINGLTAWQNKVRWGAAASTSHVHASFAGKAFKELPEEINRSLSQYGFNEKKWDLIRKAEKHVDAEGRKFIVPDNFAKIEASAFDSVIDKTSVKTEKGLANLREQARKDLVIGYQTMINDIATTAATEGNLVEKSIMNQGQRKGTAVGTGLSHLTSYKSFTATMMRKTLGREIYGYSAVNDTLPQALKKVMLGTVGLEGGNKQAAQGLMQIVAMSTLMGYAAMSLKDISKGLEPRTGGDSPEEWGKILAASAAQGGGFGIFGDFMFGEAVNRFGGSAVTTLVGPTGRTVNDIVDLFQRATRGEDFGGKLSQTLLNFVPGSNLPYTRALFNYGVTYRLQEALNPGYLERMEERLQTQKNQNFFISPR